MEDLIIMFAAATMVITVIQWMILYVDLTEDSIRTKRYFWYLVIPLAPVVRFPYWMYKRYKQLV